LPVTPPAPPLYAPPLNSSPPAAFANPEDASEQDTPPPQSTESTDATEESEPSEPAPETPSPFANDFLRIFDDDELEEHAATEVFTRKPGQMLFDEPSLGGVPVPGDGPTKPGELPGKVVARKDE
jgi:hypothetical protein